MRPLMALPFCRNKIESTCTTKLIENFDPAHKGKNTTESSGF